MSEKINIEVQLDYEQFIKNFKLVEFKQITAKSYEQLILIKSFLEQNKKFQVLSKSTINELEKKCEDLTVDAEKEVKEADMNVNNWVTNLVTNIFEFHKPIFAFPEDKEFIPNCVNKIRRLCNILGGGLDPEMIFHLTKIIFISK